MNTNPTASPGTLQSTLDQAQGALGDLKDLLVPIRQSFEQAISENPIKTAVLSFATGVFLGWLIKR